MIRATGHTLKEQVKADHGRGSWPHAASLARRDSTSVLLKASHGYSISRAAEETERSAALTESQTVFD